MSISDVLLDEGGAFHNVKADAYGAVGSGGVDDGPTFVLGGAEGHILVPAAPIASTALSQYPVRCVS